MLSVDEAIAAILRDAAPLAAEEIGLAALKGRVLAEDARARLTQPPFDASAMDGYAVRLADAAPGARLAVTGVSRAGAPFAGAVGAGEAVRIFTGGVAPSGADHVVIQEDVAREGETIIIREPQSGARNIRKAGLDFEAGIRLAKAGEALHELHGAIFAAANLPRVSVYARPRVVIFSNGDELRPAGTNLKPGEIVDSNHYALVALANSWGAEARYLGCAPDREDAIRAFFESARASDVIVPVGGASVGDHDFVKTAFRAAGGKTIFEKVAVKPGKPVWFGKFDGARVVGLPGNPASAIVTAALFVQPLIRRLAGRADAPGAQSARLTAPLAANGGREAYLRARTAIDKAGVIVSPFDEQDSSLLSPFLSADALIRRCAHAPAVAAGESVDIVYLR